MEFLVFNIFILRGALAGCWFLLFIEWEMFELLLRSEELHYRHIVFFIMILPHLLMGEGWLQIIEITHLVLPDSQEE